MAETTRVAVIGLGAMGANHARVYGELPEAELVAVADIDEERLAGAGGSVLAYRDYLKLLAEEPLDAVSVAVLTRLHLEVALACIDRGVPLLVEKPLAVDAEECAQLSAAAEAAGVPLMVGHVERFNPAVQELKRRLDAGDAGRVYQVLARRVGPFFRRGRDVGVIHDLATHDIDLFRHLLGREVEVAHAETLRGVRTEHDDAVIAQLRFEDGVLAALEVNWLTPVKVRELTVLCERGMFVADLLGQELRCYASGATEPASDGVVAPEVVTFPGAGRAPLHAELAAFLRVARGLEPPPVSGADGVAAVRVADALMASARRGEAVSLVGERPVS